MLRCACGFDFYVCIADAELREKLNKILASDYFTTTPEMKAPGDVAAAVGKYGVACQVPISESMVAPSPVVQTEGAPTPAPVSCQQKVKHSAAGYGSNFALATRIVSCDPLVVYTYL